MQYAKPWLSLDEQADTLISKGLVCERNELIAKLREAGYYRLSAYWHPYKIEGEGVPAIFIEGTTLDSIWRTYLLDQDLRITMFKAIPKIEIYLRSRLAYFAAKTAGPFGYPTKDEARLRREYAHSSKSELYTKHFKEKYGDSHDLPPYWIMLEATTMGTMEMLYRDAEPEVRIYVSNELGIKVPVFKNWLSIVRVARNACCHHSRIWNRTWGVKPTIPKSWKPTGYSNDRTFSVLTVLNYTLNRIDSENNWAQEIEKLLAEYEDVNASYSMGFPTDWRQLPTWKQAV